MLWVVLSGARRGGGDVAKEVSGVMTRRVVTAAPDDTVAEVARRPLTHAVGAVPVCDGEGHAATACGARE